MDALQTDAQRRLVRWGTTAVAVALALPMACVIAARDDRSAGDVALVELRLRDVLSSHPPLTGAYSRYGWSHPGPLLFDLFAVPYRILGNDADALRWTTLAFNTCVVVVLLWLVSARGTAAWVGTATATSLLVWGLIPHSLSDGWNVTVAILPFLLAIVACWCALCGDRWALLVTALSFTWVFQAHVGFGLVLAPLVLVTLAARLVGWWRDGRRALAGTAAARFGAAVALVAVLFLPVLYDTAAHWPGNLGRLIRWSAHNDETKLGLVDGARIVGRTASLSFLAHPQYPGRFVLTISGISTGFLPWAALVLLAAATWLARSRRFRPELALCQCLWLTWAAALVAAASIAEPLFPWLIDWLQPLGWATWMAVALVGWRTVQHRVQRWAAWPDARTVGAALVAAALLAGAAVEAHDDATTRYLSADAKPAIDALARGAEQLDDDRPVPITYEGDQLTAGTLMSGIVAEAEQHGTELCVEDHLAHQFGRHRVCSGPSPAYLLVREEQFVVPAPGGADTLAISDPYSPSQRAEADALSEDLAATLVATGHEDQVFLLYTPLVEVLLDGRVGSDLDDRAGDVDRLAELRRIRGVRYGLYLVPG
jgi:hypothetical protein